MQELDNDKLQMYRKYMFYIDKRGLVRTDLSPCWRWNASFASSGYGQICIKNIRWNAHRLSYFIHNNFEDIEKGKHVCHKCDNKECSNPEHLYLGTPKDNSNDVFDRGIKKTARVKETKYGHTKGKLFTSQEASGENNIKAILNWEQVREIRRRKELGLKYGELKKMAEEFGIKYITIQKIVANKLWIEK